MASGMKTEAAQACDSKDKPLPNCNENQGVGELRSAGLETHLTAGRETSRTTGMEIALL